MKRLSAPSRSWVLTATVSIILADLGGEKPPAESGTHPFLHCLPASLVWRKWQNGPSMHLWYLVQQRSKKYGNCSKYQIAKYAEERRLKPADFRRRSYLFIKPLKDAMPNAQKASFGSSASSRQRHRLRLPVRLGPQFYEFLVMTLPFDPTSFYLLPDEH